ASRRCLPLGGDPTAALEAVERRVQRAMLDDQHFARGVLDVLGDAVAVRGAEQQRLEDEHVERALEELELIAGLGHRVDGRLSTISIVDTLPSVNDSARARRTASKLFVNKEQTVVDTRDDSVATAERSVPSVQSVFHRARKLPPPRRLARVFEEGSRALVIRVTVLHCLRVNA